MSAATQNEMERLRRVNAEYQQLLDPMWAYVDQHGLAKLGELRSTALVRSHASLSQQLDEALEREAALAAHVEALAGLVRDGMESDNEFLTDWDKLARKTVASLPTTSLARRDLIKQAEALEYMANEFDEQGEYRGYASQLENRAADLRRRAQEPTP